MVRWSIVVLALFHPGGDSMGRSQEIWRAIALIIVYVQQQQQVASLEAEREGRSKAGSKTSVDHRDQQARETGEAPRTSLVMPISPPPPRRSTLFFLEYTYPQTIASDQPPSFFPFYHSSCSHVAALLLWQ